MVRNMLKLALEFQAVPVCQAADGGVEAVVAQTLSFEAVEAAILKHKGQDATDLRRRFPSAGGGTIGVADFPALAFLGWSFFWSVIYAASTRRATSESHQAITSASIQTADFGPSITCFGKRPAAMRR